MNFRRFIAIDWSGTRDAGKGLKGLEVAACGAGDDPPELIAPAGCGLWRRSLIGPYLLAEAKIHGRVLAGLDFAFALPHCDDGVYFPGDSHPIASVFDLWRRIDEACEDEAEFYAGPIQGGGAPLARYFNGTKEKGSLFRNRLRITEEICKSAYRETGSSTFNCVGPQSVGCGTLSGMRFLHHLRARAHGLAIWPFEPVEEASLVLADIFPRLMFRRALDRSRGVHNFEAANAAIVAYRSRPFPAAPARDTEDAWDALVTAAALRGLAAEKEMWQPPAMTPCARAHEGWMFGV